MKHLLRRLMVNATTNTPFEHALRAAYRRLSHSQNARYDRELTRLMARALQADSNCVDVGCYRGDILREMIRLAPRGSHIAFEPVPENFRYLTAQFPTARVLDIALSDRTGEETFRVVVGRTARSGLMKVDYPDPTQEVRTIKVQVDRLDNVIPRATRVDFIKIDVEGAELRVLRGGQDLIRDNKPMIVFEHGYERARYYHYEPEQLYDLLTTELGLEVSLIARWLQGSGSMGRPEFCSHVYQKLDFCFVAYPMRLTH